ncbi:hypothetical protein M408DRAFT_330408, partial [Serendipita vermifera MAFF 305830]
MSSSLGHLKHLKLWYDHPSSSYDLENMPKYLWRLLISMDDLESLIGDIPTLSIVLKKIWETTPLAPTSNGGASRPSCSSGILNIQRIAFRVVEGQTSCKLTSKYTRESVVELARFLGVINPEESWNYILHQLKEYQPRPVLTGEMTGELWL